MTINNIINSNKLTASDITKQSTDVNNSGGSFEKFLSNAINNLNQSQVTAENEKVQVATGQSNNLVQAMVDSQKAEVSLQFAVQIRNKVVDAYNEIMRMQL